MVDLAFNYYTLIVFELKYEYFISLCILLCKTDSEQKNNFGARTDNFELPSLSRSLKNSIEMSLRFNDQVPMGKLKKKKLKVENWPIVMR